MNRILGFLSFLAVMILAMGFAMANAGNRATLDLGLFTLYRVQVTWIAFTGLLVGMVVMLAIHISIDLKVRQILRERLADEAEEEKRWIDKNQQDLFAVERDRLEDGMGEGFVEEDEVGPDPVVSVENEVPSSSEAEVQDETGSEPAVTVEDPMGPDPVVPVENEMPSSSEAGVQDEAGSEPAVTVTIEENVQRSPPVEDVEEAGTEPATAQEERETLKE